MDSNLKENLKQIVDRHGDAIERQLNEAMSSLQSLGIPLSQAQICCFFDMLSNRLGETCKKVQMACFSLMDKAQPLQLAVSMNDWNTLAFASTASVEMEGACSLGYGEALDPIEEQHHLVKHTNNKIVSAEQVEIETSNAQENEVAIDGLIRYGGVGQPNVKFIKVNVDCWEHVFDFLSMQDILAMSQTCQRMHRICGYYYRENFHGTECVIDSSQYKRLRCSAVKLHACHDNFFQFIDSLSVENTRDIQIDCNENSWRSLTKIDFWDCDLDGMQLWSFTIILNNLETIRLAFITLASHSLGQFLALCPNLKCLQFEQVTFTIEARNSIFERVYPKLIEFQIVCDDYPYPPLARFLQQNPSIKHLRIGLQDLWKVDFSTLSSRWDCLSVYIYDDYITGVKLADKLKTLHASGYYKELQIFFKNVNVPWGYEDEAFINGLRSCSALSLLYLNVYRIHIIVHLTQLKELHLRHLNFHRIELDALKAVAKNVKNLELLWIEGELEQFLPFVEYSKKLQVAICEDDAVNKEALNVFKMNEMRKMVGARYKLQIGVKESQYLATKWTTQRAFDLVEVIRMEKIRTQFDDYDLHA